MQPLSLIAGVLVDHQSSLEEAHPRSQGCMSCSAPGLLACSLSYTLPSCIAGRQAG